MDRYKRTLALLYIDTLNVNEAMLRDGIAWHFKKYDKNKAWADLEKSARDNKKGIGADNNPVPPWKWRKKK